MIHEGEKINREIQLIYEKVNRLLKDTNMQKQGFSIYYLYPFFFMDDFKGIDLKDFNTISKSSALYSDAILFYDKCQDSQTIIGMDLLLQKSLIIQESIRLLSGLFTEESLFWNYFESYISQYMEAINLEVKKHKGLITPFTYQEFQKIARGKSAIAKTAVAALGCLSGEISKISVLEETQELFAEAAQLFDDLRDWREDFRSKQYTWLLTDIIIKHELNDEVEEKVISDLLFSYRYDELILERINMLCEMAMLKAGITEAWIRRIKAFQSRADKLFLDLGELKGQKFLSSLNSKKRYKGISKSFIENKMNFLLEQRRKGYPELKHWMVFLNSEGFSGREQCQGGDVFQRAFVLNLILEIRSVGIDVDRSDIEKEIDYLIGKKSSFFKYGWSYFPDLPELSPDIDSLSEMVKIWFLTKENEEMKAYIDNTVEFVINNCSNDNGAFNTWILDENDKSISGSRALKAAKELWGTEPDSEVNANFLYALSLIDYKKYEKVINRGVEWLLKKQNKEGYWENTWYEGNYYGCYICARLFKLLNIKNEKTNHMVEYIKYNQNPNGSWGKDFGNVLDTSYAVLALLNMSGLYEEEDFTLVVKKGVSYIVKCENEFGVWTGYDFIKMNTGRVTSTTNILKYKSSILTNAVCLYTLAMNL